MMEDSFIYQINQYQSRKFNYRLIIKKAFRIKH